MNRGQIALVIFLAAATSWCTEAAATPSTHVWTPSTDIQLDRTLHLTADMYVPAENDRSGSKPDTVTNLGLEAGLWPIKDTLGLEFGFDVINGYGELDDHPLYLNGKLGVPENVLAEHSPAVAFGVYNVGTEHDQTDVNTYYLKAGKTLSVSDFSLGRFSFGWYWGNPDLLLDADSDSDANGVLLTWERTITELSENLWACVDYQGSDSGLGAFAPGISWKFADNTSVIFGYVIPNNDDLADSFTVQVDIDLALSK